MDVIDKTDDAMFAAINLAPRAMVFLSVPWSCLERVGRADFKAAVERFKQIGLEVQPFVMDEESPLCEDWLVSLREPRLSPNRGYAKGWGTVIWLEFGRVVSSVTAASEVRLIGLIQQTKLLWK